MPRSSNKPTLQTVALEANVSVAAVSQVMRGVGRISEDTRQRVLAAADRLHYLPDGRAASMRSGENREIGLIVHRLANPFNAELISGASDRLDEAGYLLSVLDSRDDPQRQRRNLEAFISSARGGLLWVPAVDTDTDVIELIQTHNIPCATLLRQDPAQAYDHVGIENTAATTQATRFLAELGHRHIAYFGGLHETDVRLERIAGYRHVVEQEGLAPALIWPCGDRRRDAMDAALALRQRHPKVTALVCNGDMVALGASVALARQGLQIGKDMSIIGFDDSRDAALATPPLTTMAVSTKQLGRQLADVLIERMRNPKAPRVLIKRPAELVERASTGPGPTCIKD